MRRTKKDHHIELLLFGSGSNTTAFSSGGHCTGGHSRPATTSRRAMAGALMTLAPLLLEKKKQSGQAKTIVAACRPHPIL
jgi:hypothetical protein